MFNHENDLYKIFYHRIKFDNSKLRILNFAKGFIRLFRILSNPINLSLDYILLNEVKSNSKTMILMVVTSENQFNRLKHLKFNDTFRIYCFKSRGFKNQFEYSCEINYIDLEYLLRPVHIKIPKLSLIREAIRLGILFSELDKLMTLAALRNMFNRFSSENNIAYFISANDHSFWQQMIKYSLSNEVKKLFFQHALTNPKFLPLDYDLAFLWGKRSFDIYSRNFSKSILINFGKLGIKPSFSNECKNNRVIGIAINKMDDLVLVRRFVLGLIRSSYEVIVRPHPNMNEMLGLVNDRSDMYFDRIDIQVAGLSGIHVDALERKIKTFVFPWLNFPAEFIGRELGIQVFDERNLKYSLALDIDYIISGYQSDVDFELLLSTYDNY